jgi:hypothetical protein
MLVVRNQRPDNYSATLIKHPTKAIV